MNGNFLDETRILLDNIKRGNYMKKYKLFCTVTMKAYFVEAENVNIEQ